MRLVDKAEDMPFLSPPIRAPLPEKLPVASKDGKFVTGIDGKLSTSLPLPPTSCARFRVSGYYGTLVFPEDAPPWMRAEFAADYGPLPLTRSESVAEFLDWTITTLPLPPTRSQSLTAAGHCRRATWRSLPSDE